MQSLGTKSQIVARLLTPDKGMELTVARDSDYISCKLPSENTWQQLSSVHFSQGLPDQAETVEAVVHVLPPSPEGQGGAVKGPRLVHEAFVCIMRHLATK